MAELTYKDKIFRYKLTVIYRTVLIIAALIAVIAIIKVQFDNKVYTGIEVVYEIEKKGVDNAKYEMFHTGYLTYSDDGISAYNAKGEQIWNKTYEMQSPIVRINDTYVAVGDYKGNKLYIMDKDGATGEVETNMPIMDLSISAKGVVAATLQDDETTWVKLYSSTGVEISDIKTTMKNTGYPIATAVSADNIKLGVAYLKAQSGAINTSIAFYNFGDVGQNQTDHLVSGKDYTDKIIPYLQYVDSNNAVALSEDELLIFKGKEKPALEKTVKLKEEVQSIFCENNRIILVFNNTQSKAAYRMDVYNLNGEKEFSKKFNVDYQDIRIKGGNIIIYSESEVLIYNQKGKKKYQGDMGGDIVSVIPTDKKTKFLIVRGKKIEMVKLQ